MRSFKNLKTFEELNADTLRNAHSKSIKNKQKYRSSKFILHGRDIEYDLIIEEPNTTIPPMTSRASIYNIDFDKSSVIDYYNINIKLKDKGTNRLCKLSYKVRKIAKNTLSISNNTNEYYYNGKSEIYKLNGKKSALRIIKLIEDIIKDGYFNIIDDLNIDTSKLKFDNEHIGKFYDVYN